MEKYLLKESDKRDKRFNFRVSEAEYANIHAFCKIHGLSVTRFIRKAVNEYAARNFSNVSGTELAA